MPNGAYRAIAAQPFDLKFSVDGEDTEITWHDITDDSALSGDPSILRLSFKLKKGLYATTMINEMTNGGATEG